MAKKGDDGLGPHLADGREDQAHGHGDSDAVGQGLAASLVEARPGVLGGHGRDGGEHGRRHQEEEADDLLHDPHGGGHVHAPAVGDGGDDQESDLDKAVLEGDGETDAQDHRQAGFVGRRSWRWRETPMSFFRSHSRASRTLHPWAITVARAAPAAPRDRGPMKR